MIRKIGRAMIRLATTRFVITTMMTTRMIIDDSLLFVLKLCLTLVKICPHYKLLNFHN